MHETQRIINNMISVSKEKLSELNEKKFTMSEIFDFMEDVVFARRADISAKKVSGKEEYVEVDKVFENWSKK